MKENKDKVVRESLITLMNFVKEQSVSSLVEQGRIIKLNDEDLRIWNNVRNEEVNDIDLKFIPQLVSYFLNQSPIAIIELERAILEI